MAELYQTNAQLVARINALLDQWKTREDQFRDWLGGTATGGPNEDGQYPLSDSKGGSGLYPSVALLSSTVSGPAAVAAAARDEAVAKAASALSEANRAEASKSLAAQFKTEAQQARDLALSYQNQTAWYWAQVSTMQGNVGTNTATVLAARDITVAARDETTVARDDTLVAKAATLVARDQAQGYASSINPALLATKAELAAQLNALVDAAPGTLDTLREIATALGNDPNFATTMTTQLAGKAPLSHIHVVADVSGLQTALDGKSNVGHTHAYLPIGGNAVSADYATRLQSVDDRNTNDQPQGKAGNRLSFDFKLATSVGSPPVSANGSYSHILTVAGWDTAGGSGGWPSQVSFGDGMAIRQATSGTAWGPWRKVWHDGIFNPANYLPLAGGVVSGDLVLGGITTGGHGRFHGGIRATGWYGETASGDAYKLGAEIGQSGGLSYLVSYNRNSSAYGPLTIGATNVVLNNGTAVGDLYIGSTSGLRLHHNAANGYVDVGGLLYFRKTDGTVLATLQNTGDFYARDFIANRGNNTGVIYLGPQAQNRYLYFDGSEYHLPGARTRLYTALLGGTSTLGGTAEGATRITSLYGFLDIGPLNSGFCHYQTDRPAHYFNTHVQVNGTITRYGLGGHAFHMDPAKQSAAITVSTAAPSGGTNGDIWLKIT